MAKKGLGGSLGEPLFRYAIITDTHLRPEGGDTSSPWRVNLLANDRARWVVDRTNLADPDFVVHMGDIVHPLPHLPTYGSAAEAALEIFKGFKAPFYCIPGNHDVGDKRNPTMPAYTVDDLGLSLYERWFGSAYRSFDHRGVHFVMINAQALNSGLAQESEQSRWLEADLEASRGRRIHLFSHYPPYVLEPGEPSNYDNLDEPARSWLLGLLERNEVEALFVGHVHNFLYQRHGTTDCYNVPATSFVRQDYSEMFRVEATEGFGRNDAQKLGWCIVDVYQGTHVARIHRSGGATLRGGETPLLEAPKVRTLHTRESAVAPLGVHLRHPWAEEVDLPYNGPLDEFIRKRVRNDYALLGLWECGIRKLRVPLSDLTDDRMRARMRAVKEMGHCFTVFCFGVPSGAEREVLKHHSDLVDALEIVLPWRDAGAAIPDLLRLRETAPVRLFLAKIESSIEREQTGSKFSHYVGHGFRTSNIGGIQAFLGLEDSRGAADGFVFHIGADEPPWDAIQAIGAYASNRGFSAIANVRLASENPAEYLSDNVRVANRVAEAMAAAAATENVNVFLDTFIDIDRGYFPRVGLYDRRHNPRLGGRVFAHMQGVLNVLGPGLKLGKCTENSDGKTCVLESGRAAVNLFLPPPGGAHLRRLALLGGIDPGTRGLAKLVDLDSGWISEAAWEKRDKAAALLNPGSCRVPSLLIIEE